MKQFLFKYLILIILIPLPAGADIIYFKDGLKTVCQHRAWEEGGQIKCEYDGGILTYQKSDVMRIQKVPLAPQIEKNSPNSATGGDQIQPLNSTSRVQAKSHAVASGVLFYDPRRPNKYWTGETSRHNSYQAAIAAFAGEFDRSPEWIEQHMGETNDLIEIRRNLAQGEDANQPSPGKIETSGTNGIEFYNPRRPYKYWAGPNAKFHNYRKVLEALARQFDCTPDWVENHMGDTNDLGEIHQNLADSKNAETEK